MSETKLLTLPELKNKGVTRGVAAALAFCFFGLGFAANSMFTLPSPTSTSGSVGLPKEPGSGGGFPGGAPGGMPSLKGTVTEVRSDHYLIKTDMGISVEVPLDSDSTIKVGDHRELKVK